MTRDCKDDIRPWHFPTKKKSTRNMSWIIMRTRITAVVNIHGPVDFGRFDPVEMDKSRRGMSRTVTNFVGDSVEDYNKTPKPEAEQVSGAD